MQRARSSTGLCPTPANSTQVFFGGVTLSDSKLCMPCVPCWCVAFGQRKAGTCCHLGLGTHRPRHEPTPARREAAGAAAGER